MHAVNSAALAYGAKPVDDPERTELVPREAHEKDPRAAGSGGRSAAAWRTRLSLLVGAIASPWPRSPGTLHDAADAAQRLTGTPQRTTPGPWVKAAASRITCD